MGFFVKFEVKAPNIGALQVFVMWNKQIIDLPHEKRHQLNPWFSKCRNVTKLYCTFNIHIRTLVKRSVDSFEQIHHHLLPSDKIIFVTFVWVGTKLSKMKYVNKLLSDLKLPCCIWLVFNNREKTDFRREEIQQKEQWSVFAKDNFDKKTTS